MRFSCLGNAQFWTKKNYYLFAVFILLSFFTLHSNVGYGQANPLFSRGGNADSVCLGNSGGKESVAVAEHSPSLFGIEGLSRFIKKNAQLQRQLKESFFSLANDYKSGAGEGMFLIFLFSFLYGILHSLGPGHGKVFIFSFILAEKPNVPRAIGISYLVAAIHALSGLVASLAVIYLLGTYPLASDPVSGASDMIARFSFALLAVLGAIILVKNLAGKGNELGHGTRASKSKSLVPFLLSIGLVPCPGTIITVTFFASAGLLHIAIASAFFIALGMGFTISAIGLLSLLSKRFVLRLFSGNEKVSEKIYWYFSVFGAMLLMLLGTWFFIGSFY